VSDCEAIGAFADIVEVAPKNADVVYEMHTFIDEGGAVHYCYYGELEEQIVSRYGYQTNWNTFVEEPLVTTEGEVARCGALVVTSDDSTVVMSRSPGAMLFRQGAGAWASVEFDGLKGIEAQGALSGNRTLILLVPDDAGGVYVGMSLGYEIEAQPVYLAHADPSGLDVLANGWSESGEYSVTGHAPQVVAPIGGGDVAVVLGRVQLFDVVLADEALDVTDQTEGLYPRVAVGADGVPQVLYVDHNFELHLDLLQGGAFETYALLGAVGLNQNSEGQLPWDMDVDGYGTTHVLFEDYGQGPRALLYRSVDASAEISAPTVITSDLDDEMPGMQRYAMSSDICGRATITMLEVGEDPALPRLRVVEGR